MKGKSNGGLIRQAPATAFVVVALIAGLVLSILWAVTIGSTQIPFRDVYTVIFQKLGHILSGDAQWGTGSLYRDRKSVV